MYCDYEFITDTKTKCILHYHTEYAMTTIAYDGVSLCTDSVMISGNLRFGKIQKIYKLDDGSVFALAGSYNYIVLIIAWLNGKGEKPDIVGDDIVNGIIVHTDGSVSEFGKNLNIFPSVIPWAGGSGEDIAMTAMHCGKTARQAVKIACELDVYSALPIQEYKL